MATDRIDFFIAGPERGGTTVTGTLLDQYPEVCSLQATTIMTRLANLHVMVKRVVDQGGELDGVDPKGCEDLLGFVQTTRVTPFLHKCLFHFCFYENLVNSSCADVTKDVLSQKPYVEQFDFNRYMSRYDADNPVFGVSVAALFDEFVEATGVSGRLYGEQTPDNAVRVKAIKHMFPEAKFVFVIRHPIAGIASLIDRHKDVEHARTQYRKPFAFYPFADAAVMKDTLVMRFEDIVMHREAAMRKIAGFLGIAGAQAPGAHNSAIFAKYVGTSLSMDRYYRSVARHSPETRRSIYESSKDIADIFYSAEETKRIIEFREAA